MSLKLGQELKKGHSLAAGKRVGLPLSLQEAQAMEEFTVMLVWLLQPAVLSFPECLAFL